MPVLLVAIVHELDAEPMSRELREAGHRFTRLRSEGGFLSVRNTTFIVGLQDDGAVSPVVAIFERVCQDREVDVPLVLQTSLREWRASVAHRGATIFVIPVSEVLQV